MASSSFLAATGPHCEACPVRSSCPARVEGAPAVGARSPGAPTSEAAKPDRPKPDSPMPDTTSPETDERSR